MAQRGAEGQRIMVLSIRCKRVCSPVETKHGSKGNEISVESGLFLGLTQAVRKPKHVESSLANSMGWLSLLKRAGNALSNPLHRAAHICHAGAEVRFPQLSAPLFQHKGTGTVFGTYM